MRPVTDRFLQTVRGSHQMAARARLCEPGQVGVDPDGIEIPIIGGDVRLDSTADIRGTLDLTTIDESWKAAVGDAITPYGREIYVERGITYGDGSTEWVGQGYYRIYSVSQDSAPRGTLRVSAKDRMSGLIDARSMSPQSFGAGTSVSSIFDYLVEEVYGSGVVIVFDFDAASATFPTAHVLEEDRYKFLKDIADSFGKVMYYDYAGRLRIESAPEPSIAVFDVSHGEGGVLVSVSRTLTRDGVYNAVVATGEVVGEFPPVRAGAYDLNPNSPTFWNGPFGQVPMFYSSSFITTEAQAQSAADSILQRQLGVPYEMSLTMVPNPALEPLDPIAVSYDDRELSELHVLQSITIPLTPEGAMQATTKTKILEGN